MTDPTRDARIDRATALAAGADVTTADAVALATALLEIAEQAMPGTHFAADSRCRLARAVLARSAATSPPLDDFAKDILGRCRWARRHNDGHPNAAWSHGEQLAVAAVLRDEEFLGDIGYTVAEAADNVAGRMSDPPADINAWMAAIRTHLEAQR